MDLRSNEPYSLVKNAFPYSYPSLKESASAQVLVVGAGVTGALMGYQLLCEGKEIIIVDRRDVAMGSTAASTSILQYEIDVPLHVLIDQIGLTPAVSSYQNCQAAIFKLKEIVDTIKSDCGFQYRKSIYFASSKNKVKFLRNEFEARLAHGFDVKWLDSAVLATRGLTAYAAIESAVGATMDVYKFTLDLLKYLSDRGARIYDRTEIVAIKEDQNTLRCTTQQGAQLTAGAVVHCTGYESVNTVKKKIVNLKSTFALASESFKVLPGTFTDSVYWNTDSPYLYFRATADNRIMMGGGDRDFKNAKLRDALLPRKEKELTKAFKKCFPEIPFVADYSWAGTFGETEDGLPYFGQEDPHSRQHYLLAFGGNGITFSVMGMEALIHSLNKSPHPFLEYYKFDR